MLKNSNRIAIAATKYTPQSNFALNNEFNSYLLIIKSIIVMIIFQGQKLHHTKPNNYFHRSDYKSLEFHNHSVQDVLIYHGKEADLHIVL